MGYKKKKITRAAVAQWGDIMVHVHWSESKEAMKGTSLAFGGLRFHLPRQGTQVWYLVQELRSHMLGGS